MPSLGARAIVITRAPKRDGSDASPASGRPARMQLKTAKAACAATLEQPRPKRSNDADEDAVGRARLKRAGRGVRAEEVSGATAGERPVLSARRRPQRQLCPSAVATHERATAIAHGGGGAATGAERPSRACGGAQDFPPQVASGVRRLRGLLVPCTWYRAGSALRSQLHAGCAPVAGAVACWDLVTRRAVAWAGPLGVRGSLGRA